MASDVTTGIMREQIDARGFVRGLTSFVGRHRELSAIGQLVLAERLVTLTGSGGVGKTRLAFEVQHRAAWPGEVAAVELASLRDPDLLAHTVATAVGVPNWGSRSAADALADHIGGKPFAILLDNCEHLIEACADFTLYLLQAAPSVTFLTTSRQPLGVPGEHLFPILPLPTGDARREGGADSDALRLFEDRARAVVADFKITAENREDVLRICEQLDGIPLAIELASVRLRALAVPELAARLDRTFDLLTQGGRLVPQRHQTLRAAIEWSFDLCSPQERLLWQRLSVFAGGFGVTGAEKVCADTEFATSVVLESLEGLVEKSILLRTESGGQARFQMLETIREYGHDQLVTSGTENEFRARHSAWCVDLLDEGRKYWFGVEQEMWSSRLRQEYPNLRAAFEFSLSQGQLADAAATVIARSWFLWVYVLFGEGSTWLARIVEQDVATSLRRGDALATLGYVTALEGEKTRAHELARECRAIAADLSDGRLLAYGTHVDGLAMLFEDPPGAIAPLRDAVSGYLRAGAEAELWVGAEIQLGLALLMTGDTRGASGHFQECISHCAERGEQWEQSYCLYGLGFVAHEEGRVREAAELTLRAIDIKRRFADALGLALALDLYAWVCAAEQRWEAAASAMGAAYTAWASFGRQLFDSEHWMARRTAVAEQAKEQIGLAGFERAFESGAATAAGDFADGLFESGESKRVDPLSRREREVAAHVAEGLSNRDIAAKLHVSQRTVESHLEHAFAKLKINNRAQLAAWVAGGN